MLQTPTITPNGGIHSQPAQITIACTTGGATIRYTTDGSAPTPTFGAVYSAAFPLVEPGPRTIRAIAYKNNLSPSEVASSLPFRIIDVPFAPIQPVTNVHSLGNGVNSTSQMEIRWVAPFDNYEPITG